MPANYVLIAESTTSTSVASVTLSNIPQTGYTDLKLVVSARTSAAGADPFDFFTMNLNGVTTGYNRRLFYGFSTVTGTTASADSRWGAANSNSTSGNYYANIEFYIPNYTTTTAKCISIDSVQTNNSSTVYSMFLAAGSSTNTTAVSSIVLTADGSALFLAGCTFSLYGIAAFGVTPTVLPKATGGDIVANDGTYWYHAFLSTGTFVPQSNLSCDVLVVAGGAGGGYWNAGGGGAGGLIAFTAQSLTAQNYAITIGAGGNAGTSGGIATNGANSQFASLTAAVGGGYGGADSASGGAGGSGGGAGYGATGGGFTSGQGTAGGAGDTTGLPVFGGGGGGATVAGANGTSGNGAGGNGSSAYSSWGLATTTGQNVTGTCWYAGGGSGGNQTNTNTLLVLGGNGGGGSSGYGYNATVINPTAGTANTGGGGGGGTATNPGANGGSGIIIVRYTMA
jgi:hypothetical protein